MLKLFVTIQEECAIIGIAPQNRPINRRSLPLLLMDGFTIVSSGAYFFIEAKSLQEHAESIFVSTTIIAISAEFAFVLFKMRQFFYCLNEAEQIIESSAFWHFFSIMKLLPQLRFWFCSPQFLGSQYPISRAIYNDANQTIEKCSKILFFGSIKILHPVLTIPILLVNFHAYFASDMDNDVFQMPFPYW